MDVLAAAGHALVLILQPSTMLYLCIGVVIGLAIGLLPGISGVAGMALLLPFTYTMKDYEAFAFLLGMGSVVTTSDVLPAVLFGVPGHSSAQSTVLDGYPMSQRGEAGRALSASYMSALLGGLFGALVLALAIPVLRPVMLYIGSPELLAFALFGVSMVAVLSGNTPLRGLAGAGLGVVLAMVGTDPQGGSLRWTLSTLYLWDGLPLLPVALGLFAFPALCDLAVARTAIASSAQASIKSGMVTGAQDAFRHWWLILRCGGVGAGIGAIPGLGHAVIGWLAYAYAARTEPGASETFGKGDVRGIIASEAANNAKEGGGLVPTIAFGVPAGASMAILLGAFLIHGLVPGPEMLTKHLDLTYAMMWSVVLANILGSALCYLFSGYFAKLTTLRYTTIVPCVLVIVFVGAFQAKHDWGDLYVLLVFGLLGWIMKELKWPRPPLVLGFVLGGIIERYMFISVERDGAAWAVRPLVIAILLMTAIGIIRPILKNIRARGNRTTGRKRLGRPQWSAKLLLPLGVAALVTTMMVGTAGWAFNASVVPVTVGIFTILASMLTFANQLFRAPTAPLASGTALHFDERPQSSALEVDQVVTRTAIFFGWTVLFVIGWATIGLLPTVPLFMIGYMRAEGREDWLRTTVLAVSVTLFVYVVFDFILQVAWPVTLLGQMFPGLRIIPSI
jgi:TctA family transporter